jgi:hypothetical protein
MGRPGVGGKEADRVDLDVAHAFGAPERVVVGLLQSGLAHDGAQRGTRVPVPVEVNVGHLADVPDEVRHGVARRIQALRFRLDHQAGQRRPVFLQPGHGGEVRIAEDEHGLIAGGAEAPQDLGHLRGVERDDPRHPLQYGAQGVHRRSEELHRVAGHVFGDHPPDVIVDLSPRRRQRNRSEPVGLGPELKLVVLDDLCAEEGAKQHRERADDDPSRDPRPLVDAVGIEDAHASTRRSKNCLAANSTIAPAAAVMMPWTGA